MKSPLRIRVLFFAAIAIGTGMFAHTAGSGPVIQEKLIKPRQHIVVISGMKFHPEVIQIQKGDTVTWENKDIVDHCVTEYPSKKWTSSILDPGKSWKKAITGSCDYYCSLHVVMKGKIIVK